MNTGPAAKLISILYRQSQIYLSHELKDFNITSSQYSFLLALYKQDGISQESLSEQLCIDKSATKRAVDLLVSNGYVNREKNPEDKRAYRLFLTEKAHLVKEPIFEALHKWNAAISRGIEKPQLDVLLETLNLMTANVLSQKNHPGHHGLHNQQDHSGQHNMSDMIEVAE
jgi:DNA-binding MarR family transcriptional regulator